MKVKLLLGLVLSALILNFAFQGASFAGGSVGDTAEDFALSTVAGGDTVSFSDHKGKANIILLFWTIKAPYGEFEMKKLRDRYPELQKNGFEIITVATKKEESVPVKEFITAENIAFPVLLDVDAEVAKKYEVKGLPVILVIDKQGQIRWRGYQFPDNYLTLVQE